MKGFATQLLKRESAMTIFSGHWPRIDILFKRGLARSLIQFSHSMGNYVKGSEALCSALVMAVYDPWGDPVIRKLLTKQQIDQNLMHEFIRSEPCELLLIRVECLVNAHFEDAAIQLCRSYLHSKSSMPVNQEVEYSDENWRWTFMEWLLRLLFRKRKLNDLVAESSSCSCHDGVRLIYRAQSSQMEDSEPLTETLINLFLVRDLLFQSDYCCTSELMRLWCELQAKKQKSASEIQEAAQKLLVGHASCSAQFYLFVDILWEKFGVSLLPLYLEMYLRGLTSDLNYLEAARQADNKEYVIEIENHMAAMYFKLSSMFNSINKEVSLECMLSAFSLDPTKERLEWIKRLSLQIAKEKALKANASKNILCKHKTCNSNPCSHNYIHPVITKRKSVIMCDQAIQVGDELLDSCEKEQSVLSASVNNNIQENSSAIMEEMKGRMEESSVLNEITVRKDDMSIEDLKENEVKGNILPSNTCSNINSIEINEHCTQNCNSNRSEDSETSAYLETDKITSEENESDSKVTDLKTNGIAETVLEPSTLIKAECANSKKENCDTFVPSVNCNHDITEKKEKDLSIPNFDSETKNVNDKIEVSLCSKTEDLSKTLESDATIDKDCLDGNLTVSANKNEENGFASELIRDSSPDSKDTVCEADIAVNVKMKNDIQNCNENFEEKLDICQSLDCNHQCINGFEKTAPLNNENVHGHSEVADEFCTEEIVGKNRETDSLLNVKHNTLSSNENISISTKEQSQSKEHENVSEIQLFPSNKIQTNTSKSMCENICLSEMNPDSHVKNNASVPVHSFSHIILDSKIPGISCKLLSDFVIVLESLRNKQLKSCNKWSQIKHLCEDYLETVTNLRCMMLNMQLNGSIDSEADSTSELTAFQEFQSHQSNDSIVEDRYADKSHVFKRFMNTDKVTDMATYVNLSDIHYPQIPLEKLFYTEHSSSHIGHKKKHKKHRNHDKNPEKVALRKLRHSSRAERELIKRKKRKKRKGKRAKGHAKKHYFTHGKANKDYVKNKKKKHKLKKKKDGNSGFISGDYCSDFSSGELMRLVKEHSNSYSKIPAATSKHPHASSFPVGVSPSIGSSDLSNEPSRKKRKVSFNKKKEKGKCHDKHKHEKSKSSKRKKKIVIESCQAGLKNLTPQDTLNGSNINSVGDYSRIVQFASVKKMEAVQIRQRSVALNLSNQSRSRENETPLVHQCPANPQIKHLVQQNFDNYSPEDIMKMQLLLARQQPDVVVSNANSDFISSANNQAVLKYVCSKMTSHLLSVAQSSNCIVGSDSEASKSPIPVLPGKVSVVQNSVKSFNQPQNLSSNIKHVIIERKNLPYTMKNSNTSVSSGTLIPISLASPSCSDAHNMMGTVFSSGLNYPTSVASPQMTTFAIPVAHNASKNKLVAGKLMIPINTCGNIRSSSTLPSTECENHAFATASANQPLSGVILVKNGNSARIIPSSQQQCNVMPCLSAARFSLPSIRQKASTTVTKTVPKIIKQAAKKLTQPQAKKPRLKPPAVNKIEPIVPSNVVTSEQTAAVNLSSDIQPAINKSEICAIPPEISLLKSTNTDDTPSDSDLKFSGTEEKPLSDDNASLREAKQEDNKNLAENEGSVVHSPQSNNSNLAISSIPNSPASAPSSPKQKKIVEPSALNLEMKDQEILKEDMPQDSISESKSIQNSPSDKVVDTDTDMGPGTTPTAPCPSPVNENVDNTDVVMVAASESPPSEDSNATRVNVAAAIVSEKENLPLMNKAPITSTNVPVEKKEAVCTVSKNIAVSHDQQKQLQPITVGNILSSLRIPGKICSQGKAEGGNQVSEVPTRSFTSISDAVRFSLMDMDDATDSVENQVLHAFQVSHESSQDSPRYDNTSTNGGDTSTASPTPAVILTTPQSTSTTELNVSRVSQFETSVHSSQSEKFTECQSTVSRTTTWILEDSSVNETAQQIGIQKSPDVDSSGETKDDNKPKKKKKRKERSERDPDAAHKFWCEICHKGFFSAYNLRRHCRNVHKMDLPKGSSDVPFASSSQCLPHIPQTDSASSDVSAARVPYGTVQQSSVSPKAPDFMLQSPTRETKSQDFAVKSSPTQHVPQMQSTEFQMQTPPRMSSQSTSTHVSPVTPPKDFRLPTPTTVSSQITQSKLPVGKSANSTKFQRQPSTCPTSQVPQLAKMSQMPQITLCGQSALQQQRQIGQLPSAGLIQPLSSVGCQAQQLQPATQCPHFQQNKQIVQQRLGQLQLMHHVGALPPVQHATHGIQKQTPVQQFKKCVTTQQVTKITETEQIQAAQLAQNQQILANQQMQKLIQIRQNAIAAAGVASQLSLGSTVTGVQGSSTKGGAQCFQSQLAAARQAAAVAQLPANQRSQGTNYSLPSHDASGHQFFSPAIQPNQEQPSCPHGSFSTQNIAEFSANAPSYPSIRSSSETNDGLEDLEQFLLENMPWSGDQSATHNLAQQSGNRPSSADSLTLPLPTQGSGSSGQNRTASSSKGKISISRPKPRKPVATPCSKNLLGNLGRGVKKKSCVKKIVKPLDVDCIASKSDIFTQADAVNQQTSRLDLIQKTCSNKDSVGDLLTSKKDGKSTNTVSAVNETDSSDSVQCINITHSASKTASVGINFNTFTPMRLCTADKDINSSSCTIDPSSSKQIFDVQRKNSFLDHCNLVSKNCSNLDQSKSMLNIGHCEKNLSNPESSINVIGKETNCDPKTVFNENAMPTVYSKTSTSCDSGDVFLGQRNTDNCSESVFNEQKKSNDVYNCEDIKNANKCAENGCAVNCVENAEKEISVSNFKENSKSETQSDFFLDCKTDQIVNNSETEDAVIETHCMNNAEIKSTVVQEQEIHQEKEKESLNSLNNNTLTDTDSNTSNKDLYIADIDLKGADADLSAKTRDLNSMCTDSKEADTDFSAKSTDLNVIERDVVTTGTDLPATTTDLSMTSKNFNFTSSDTESVRAHTHPDLKTSDLQIKNSDKRETDDSYENINSFKDNEKNSSATNDQSDVNIYTLNESEQENKLEDIFDENSNITETKLKCKESLSDPSKVCLQNIRSDSLKSVENNCNDTVFLPVVNNHDKHVSLESNMLNDENHLPNESDASEEQGPKRIALRIRKSLDSANKMNENDKNIKYYVSEKTSDDPKGNVMKKNSQKKRKVKQENRKIETVGIDAKKGLCIKFDGDANIQKAGILNNVQESLNKEKEINRTVCLMSPCYNEIEKVTPLLNETLVNEDGFCLDEKQDEDQSMDGIPAGRLRLRDTPKTSVKRVCPCCVDSRMPKKCRANGGGNIAKLIGTRVPNALKSKSTLKTRNAANGNVKINTRSSQRLRSRNNAIN
ncbi:uncharacterized protein LOC118186114 isoform X2 [Stegodyphus dumicola]|uniref:uncharacterized protein LOC118186114 isoform X2 n=1 Tax=Stegodyphus dumicola TaxID=202533 RepID=UPI0015AA4876|nr:uncharacterized protein LOC118186114 isoform X2 [Stegodyphus dumicola]